MWALILFVVVAAVAARPGGDFYDEKYENFNVKELIENPRLLKSYALCFLGKGKCTPEGNDFKTSWTKFGKEGFTFIEWTPEAVQSQCGKCSEKQKYLTAEVIKAIHEKLPTDWEELSKEYDPKGDHTQQLNEFIQKYAPSKK